MPAELPAGQVCDPSQGLICDLVLVLELVWGQEGQRELHSPAASLGQPGACWEGNEEHNLQGSGAWGWEQLLPLPSRGSSMGRDKEENCHRHLL